MSHFVIMVEFEVAPGAMSDFLPLMLENASRSAQCEPGCRRFDVLSPDAQPERVVLYEIYDSEDAFALHCQSPHFLKFDAATRDMVAGKTVRKLRWINDTASTTPCRQEAQRR